MYIKNIWFSYQINCRHVSQHFELNLSIKSKSEWIIIIFELKELRKIDES